VLPAVDPGAGEDEPVDPRRAREGQVERHVAAQRDSHEVSTLDAERLEQPRNVRGVHERPIRERRLSVPSEVEADDAEPLGEDGQHVVPHPAVCDPFVEKQERMSFAHLVVGELDAVAESVAIVSEADAKDDGP
jgi:hypothetical protein